LTSGGATRIVSAVQQRRPLMTDALLAPMKDAEHVEIGGLTMDIARAGSARVKRVVYPPGFRWSTHMKPVVGTAMCMHAHVGFLARGSVTVRYADGTLDEFTAPQAIAIDPGHEGWVVGDEPAVLIEVDFERETVEKFGLRTRQA
jgi:hypothetical protein